MRIPRKPPDVRQIVAERLGDLTGAIQKPEYTEFARRCEAGYWPWNKVRVAAPAAGVDASLAWTQIKLGREQRYRKLPLFGDQGQQLKFIVPDRVQYDLMLIDQETAGRVLIDEESLQGLRQRERFMVDALREEAIASSMLEGAATTRRDAKKLLRSGRKPRTRAERMVVNNYHAIQFIREHLTDSLSPEFLLELQSILTEGTVDRDDAAGRYRHADDDVSVVDGRDNQTIHVPPPASELPERMEQLCRFANDSRRLPGEQFIHPVVRACVLHFQIGFDHPFCDGNGRTARALFYWSMLRDNYWLLEYLPISRLIYRSPARYIRAFLYCETDEFDVTFFLKYKTRIIGLARREFIEHLHRKQAQLVEAHKFFADDRRLNHRQREVLLQGARNPDTVFKIGDHKERFAVSYATARNDLLELADWGYLKVDTDQKRYDFYPTEKLLRSRAR